MTRHHDDRPMRIRLSQERHARLVEILQRFTHDELGFELSDFQAGRLLDHMVQVLGAPICNQAIQDARRFVHDKLDDLEGEFYEPELRD